VVGHDKSSTIVNILEVRIKFHPELESMTGETYVKNVLIPAIDISRHVPGVTVASVVKGSMKRLDK
jgi:hypothetical protein